MTARAHRGKPWLAAYGAVIAVAACSLNPQPLPPGPDDPDPDERLDGGAFGGGENPNASDDGKHSDAAAPTPQGDGGDAGDGGDGSSDASAD